MIRKQYIAKLGEFLTDNKKTMSVPELAEHLNRNNFTTDNGTEYQGKRGTYKLVKTTYDYLVNKGDQAAADKVASAFTKNNSSYAY